MKDWIRYVRSGTIDKSKWLKVLVFTVSIILAVLVVYKGTVFIKEGVKTLRDAQLVISQLTTENEVLKQENSGLKVLNHELKKKAATLAINVELVEAVQTQLADLTSEFNHIKEAQQNSELTIARLSEENRLLNSALMEAQQTIKLLSKANQKAEHDEQNTKNILNLIFG